jgi:RimJ/RimL family protein N-acetyltransferase
VAPAPRLPILTERLCLRLPTLADVGALARAGNAPEVARGTYVPYPFTPVQARQIVLRRRREARAGRSLGLVVAKREGDRPIGMVGLGAIDRHDRNAEPYYWLAPSEWGHGLASEAATAMLEMAFGPLGLHRVTAHVHVFNDRSYRLLRRLGFRTEGTLRETRPEGRRWRDARVMGLLAPEFHAERDRRSRAGRGPSAARR